MWIEYNANPQHKRVGDCVIRALSVVLNQEWEKTYAEVVILGFIMSDMPSANFVWGAYLEKKGFTRHLVPKEYRTCYTVSDFCKDFPTGKYILALDGHVIAVKDGNFYDTWNSGDEIPIYYWQRKENK